MYVSLSALIRSMSEPANVASVAQNQAQVKPNVKPARIVDGTHSQHPKPHTHGVVAVAMASSTSQPPLSCHSEYHDHVVKESGEKPLYSYLDMEGLTEDEKRNLRGRLTNEYKQISSSYSKLNQDIRSSLTRRGITPNQLASVLMELSAFSLRDSNKPLLEDCLDKIEAATSIQAVFKILRPYGSFFDCHVVKHIVNSELCTDEDRSKLQRYQKELDGYCRRNVFECPLIASSDPKFPKLVIKVDDIVSKNFTMKALDAFSVDVAQALKLSRHTLRVCSVDEGCLQLTYQISRFLVDMIFPLTPKQEEDLKSFRTLRLTCGRRWNYNWSVSQAQKTKVCEHLWIHN